QTGSKPLVLTQVERPVGLLQKRLFRAGELAGNQVIDIRQAECLIQPDQVRLYLARPHQVDAGEQYAEDVEQRLDAARALLLKQLPLGLRKAEVVVAVVPRNAAPGDRFELLV